MEKIITNELNKIQLEKADDLLKRKNKNLGIIVVGLSIILFIFALIILNQFQANNNMEKTIYTINQSTYGVLFNEVVNCKLDYKLLEEKCK